MSLLAYFVIARFRPPGGDGCLILCFTSVLVCTDYTAGGFYLGHSLGLACRPTDMVFFSGFSLVGCVFVFAARDSNPGWGDWSRSSGGCRVVCFRFFGKFAISVCLLFSRLG